MVWEICEIICVFIVLAQLLLGVLPRIIKNFVAPNCLKQKDFKSFGKWALVTGASDGIGKEYAKSLAKRGLNIILVSRTLTKLQTVAKEIEETFNVETAVIDVDFTSGVEIFDKIKDRVKGKEIGVLVNNVGIFYSSPKAFLDIPDREKMIQDIIRCNITSMSMMCSIVLPQMLQRKKGIIINLSSILSLIPAGNLCVYSASKAFVSKFSEDLSAEYEHQGIIVQSVLPGPVATNMIQGMEMGQGSSFTPSAERFVQSALKKVGFAGTTNGYFLHSVIQCSSQFWNFLAPSVYRSITRKMFRFIRKREVEVETAESMVT